MVDICLSNILECVQEVHICSFFREVLADIIRCFDDGISALFYIDQIQCIIRITQYTDNIVGQFYFWFKCQSRTRNRTDRIEINAIEER